MYGEIRFDSFAVALHKVRRYGGLKEAGGVFYDLGSGEFSFIYCTVPPVQYFKKKKEERIKGIY